MQNESGIAGECVDELTASPQDGEGINRKEGGETR